jgi:hypothetical protein
MDDVVRALILIAGALERKSIPSGRIFNLSDKNDTDTASFMPFRLHQPYSLLKSDHCRLSPSRKTIAVSMVCCSMTPDENVAIWYKGESKQKIAFTDELLYSLLLL